MSTNTTETRNVNCLLLTGQTCICVPSTHCLCSPWLNVARYLLAITAAHVFLSVEKQNCLRWVTSVIFNLNCNKQFELQQQFSNIFYIIKITKHEQLGRRIVRGNPGSVAG
jgi:hypothetical protein